jgi:phosphatidylserine/phosphatidylglycerophosphate/cardiolipin synthase-like enzyme
MGNRTKAASVVCCGLFVSLFLLASSAQAGLFGVGASVLSHGVEKVSNASARGQIVAAPQTGQVEVGFSPEGSGEQLVLKVINSAQRSVLVSAYSFTSSPVVAALLDAKKRGVDVRVVADYRNNLQEDRTGKGRAALSALANAGVPVRTIDVYPIHHDKVVIVDRIHVQTGSFNYSQSAAKANSENVIVLWNNPDIANAYVDHWVDRFNKGRDFR